MNDENTENYIPPIPLLYRVVVKDYNFGGKHFHIERVYVSNDREIEYMKSVLGSYRESDNTFLTLDITNLSVIDNNQESTLIGNSEQLDNSDNCCCIL